MMGWKREHLWETGFCLVFGGLFIFVVWAGWGFLRPAQTNNELYRQLIEIMDERKRLWFAPRDDGGTRETDISHIICPLVSIELLHEMFHDPELNASGKYFSYSVNYDYSEDRQNVYPDRSHIWTLRKRIFPISNQLLVVIITDDGGCESTYRHQT